MHDCNDCCGNDVTQRPEFMPRVIPGFAATSPTRRDALARISTPDFRRGRLKRLIEYRPTWEMIVRSQKEDERAGRPYREWTCSPADLRNIPLDSYLNRPAIKKVNNSMKTFDVKYENGYGWWLRWHDGSSEMFAGDAATNDAALREVFGRWRETLESEDSWSDGRWHTVTA